VNEEPASGSLSRRTLLGRGIQGLGVTFALGHVISRVFVRSHFGPPPAELLSDPNWRLTVGSRILGDRPARTWFDAR
jgi:hypothetical protein